MELDDKQNIKAVALLMVIGLSIAGYYAFLLTKMPVFDPQVAAHPEGGE